jgi:HlyD family secretion protein
LFTAGVASENQRDSARANRDVARGQYEVALEELKLLEAGARPDQIKAARHQLEQAEAALRLARIRLEKARIFSPISGTVLVKSSEQGEVVSPGVPIVTIADLGDMWVKIYIDEVNIGNIRLGQPARVRVDSFPEREFSGKITYISDEAEFTPKNIQTREDRVKLVFAVKVGIDNAGGLLKPGMYADIELDVAPPANGSD